MDSVACDDAAPLRPDKSDTQLSRGDGPPDDVITTGDGGDRWEYPSPVRVETVGMALAYRCHVDLAIKQKK